MADDSWNRRTPTPTEVHAAIESAERSPWTRCEDALPNFAQNVFVTENGRIFVAHRRELHGWVSNPGAYRCAPDAWQRLPEPFSE